MGFWQHFRFAISWFNLLEFFLSVQISYCVRTLGCELAHSSAHLYQVSLLISQQSPPAPLIPLLDSELPTCDYITLNETPSILLLRITTITNQCIKRAWAEAAGPPTVIFLTAQCGAPGALWYSSIFHSSRLCCRLIVWRRFIFQSICKIRVALLGVASDITALKNKTFLHPGRRPPGPPPRGTAPHSGQTGGG
jgi:hypothetical protein